MIATFLIIVSNIEIAFYPVLLAKGANLIPAFIILIVFGDLVVMGFS